MAEPQSSVTRGSLLRWLGWFGLLNAGIYALVGLRYGFAFGWPSTALAWVYALTAFIGQFAVLGVLPMILLVGPLTLVLPRRFPITVVAVCIAAGILSLIVLDANIFVEYRYHLSRLTAEIFDIATWLLTGLLAIIFLGLEAMLAGHVWRRVSLAKPKRRLGIWIGLMLGGVWATSQVIHIWADATAYSPVTSFNRYLPAYYPIKSKRQLARLGWIDPEQVQRQKLLQRTGNELDTSRGQLRYPLNKLNCAVNQSELPDILFILIDALRPDKINVEFTPRLAEFAQQSLNFRNHFSGGNSSRMGIFSMFYGLPSTYWQSFYELQQPPVVMRELVNSGYQIAAFSAVGFGSPAQIDRTVFAEVAAQVLRTPRDGASDANQAISDQWQQWLVSERDPNSPAFSFLYFDPGTAKLQEDLSIIADNSVAARYADYIESIGVIDRVVGNVLDQQRNFVTNRDSLIIIISDHGYEFDELGLGYVGHASNYGRYQLQSTLLIDWPGKQPANFDHRSAHQDIPATLLTELLQCSNPASDYSSGANLLNAQDWEWFIAGSYNSHAIVEAEQLVVTYPGGMIDLLDHEYRPAPDLKLDPDRVAEALLEMRRFYR